MFFISVYEDLAFMIFIYFGGFVARVVFVLVMIAVVVVSFIRR